ncbi:MAG: hypothetical protein GY880_10705 [Planctomycetaceae bacterium]|nr:hypothetical protein [Planctomycetaceae bacterium]
MPRGRGSSREVSSLSISNRDVVPIDDRVPVSEFRRRGDGLQVEALSPFQAGVER